MLVQLFLDILFEVIKRFAIPATIAVSVITAIVFVSGGNWHTSLIICAVLMLLAAVGTTIGALRKPW